MKIGVRVLTWIWKWAGLGSNWRGLAGSYIDKENKVDYEIQLTLTI